MHLTAGGELAYHVGAVAIVTPLDGAKRQRHYREHTAEILAEIDTGMRGFDLI